LRTSIDNSRPEIDNLPMTPFTVALCQVRAYDIEEAETNLQGILAALDEAGREGAQLVGLPECAYPAYYIKDTNLYDRPGVRPFDEVCSSPPRPGSTSTGWRRHGRAPRAGRVTNSAVVFGPGR
jgi:predicted amidohydrolase